MAVLTLQQENFSQAVASGKTQSDAYRLAYPTSQKWPDTAVWSKASQMMANAKIMERVAFLRKPLTDRVDMTLHAHVSRLAQIRDAAMKVGDHGPATRAEIAIGQVAGHYVQKLEVTNNTFAGLSAERKVEAIAFLQSVIDRRKRLGQSSDDVSDVEVK